MRIALVNPPFLFPAVAGVGLTQSYGLRQLSSVLKARGHEVNYIDALMLGVGNIRAYANGYIVGLELSDVVKRIPSDVDLIGISVPLSHMAPIGHDLIKLIRARFPGVRIVMGGVYPSTQPRLALSSEVDFIVVGEGEIAFPEILDGKDPTTIRGVYTAASLDRDSFPSAKVVEDLDILPFTDYSIPHMDRYFDLSPRGDRIKTASLVTSRGCPFDCEFCSIHPICGYKWRARSADHVLSEIGYLVSAHDVHNLEIEDDNFSLNRDRTIAILDGLIRANENGKKLSWRTPNGIMIETLDDEVIGLIKRANCTHLVLALEHGDPDMLRVMNKRIDLGQAFRVMELCAKHAIPRVTVFVILGYPGETRARFDRSLTFLKKICSLTRNVDLCINLAQPYPGTRLLARCREDGIIRDDNYDNFLVRRDLLSTLNAVAVTTPDFDVHEVWHRYDKLLDCYRPPRWQRQLAQLLPVPAKKVVKKILGIR